MRIKKRRVLKSFFYLQETGHQEPARNDSREKKVVIVYTFPIKTRWLTIQKGLDIPSNRARGSTVWRAKGRDRGEMEIEYWTAQDYRLLGGCGGKSGFLTPVVS